MKLPNFNYLVNVAELRYIQARFESPEYTNPDQTAGALLSLPQRFACMLRGRLFKSRLRANPFYHYLLARTRFYDDAFLTAISESVTHIVNIGCGSDTRAYRFASAIRDKGIRVVECDQQIAISAKQKLARRHWQTDHVTYVPLDLNIPQWEQFVGVLNEMRHGKIFIMIEGVSPYVDSKPFESFLRMLGSKIRQGSTIAYDFKKLDVVGSPKCEVRSSLPFRLPFDRSWVEDYHAAMGLQLQLMESSEHLSQRTLTGNPLLFEEDCILLLKRV
jgi:methyltransferase (TIGR00027 family)